MVFNPNTASATRAPRRSSSMETWVGECIATSLGPKFVSVHVGNDGAHDCTIMFEDSEYALVEVTQDTDQVFQQSQSFALDHPEEVIIELEDGLGEWVCEISVSVRVRGGNIPETAQRIIKRLVGDARDRHDGEFNPNRPHENEEMSGAGIGRIWKVGDTTNRLHLSFSRGIFGRLLRSDSEVLRDYVSDQLTTTRFSHKVDRLLERAAGRRAWLAIIVDSATPTEVMFRMLGEANDPGLPAGSIDLPEGLDAVWILSPQNAARLVWYQRNKMWTSWQGETS